MTALLQLFLPFDDESSERQQRAITISSESIHLQGLLEVSRLVRSGAALPDVLDELARVVAETLDFGLVVVSLERAAWDDFEVAAVHGSADARGALVGQRLGKEYWEPLLDPRFARHGAQFVPHDQRDWSEDEGTWFVPANAAAADGDAWHPADALLVPLRRTGGELLGILSVNEPRSGRRPSDDDLAVLSAFGAQIAQAIESAQEAEAAARHGATLEHLFLVSAELLRSHSIETVLRLVCDGVHAALGFGLAIVEIADRDADRYRPLAAAGIDLERNDLQLPVSIAELDRIFEPQFEVEGCFLLTRDEALERVPNAVKLPFASSRNGHGSRAWNRHWLIVPLYDRAGERIGFIWADDPCDRLIPSRERFQTLRLFANQASTALEAAANIEALHEASELSRAIIDASPLAVLTVDREARVLSWNPAAEEMYGWTAEEALGALPPQAAGAAREQFEDMFGRALRGETLTGVEAERRRKDGSQIVASLSAAPVKNAAGDVVGVVSLHMDVTDRRRAERELARRHAELEALHETTLHLLDRLDPHDLLQTIAERAAALVGPADGYVYVVDEDGDQIEMTVATGPFAGFVGTRLRRGEGLCGRVWAEGRACAVDDYSSWTGRATAFTEMTIGANIAVPLRAGDAVVGVLGLTYPPGDRVFGAAEAALLERFGRLASLALQNARLYEEVRKSRELYRKVIETSSDIVSLVAPDGTILFNSPAIEPVLGYSIDDTVGANFGAFVHPDEEDAGAGFAAALAGRGPIHQILRVKHGEGHWVDLESVLAPIKGDGDEVEMVLAISRDVTERIRYEEELRESRELYRSVVENANDLIALMDPDGRLLYVSPSHFDVLGYTPEEFLDEHVSVRVHPDDLPASDEAFRRALVDGEATYTLRLRHRDGHWVVVEGREKLLRDEQGRPRMVHSTARDVTQERALEEQLRTAQKMEAVGRLAGGIAHDFNNLLTAIDGYGGFALEQLPADSPARRHVEEMKRAGERAGALTKQLLAFSRRQVLQPKVVDLSEVVLGMEDLLRRLIGEDVDLVIRLARDGVRTKADPSQLEQVVMNLVVNARDAMPRGGTVTIDTANVELDAAFAEQHVGARPGPYVALTVTDTGEGMDRATVDRIFEPFFTTKPAGQGTGLGLSTVYGIVKQTGGSIWAYSEPGAGTTFKVYLPRVWEAAPAALHASAETRDASGGTILLVEDEAVVRELVREMLEAAGYTVLAAADGADAIELADSYDGAIAAVVTDVVMPGMSGQQVAARIAARRPDVRVLFTSGYTEDAIAHHGVLRPGAAFLEKPFTAAQLGEALRDLLAAPLAA